MASNRILGRGDIIKLSNDPKPRNNHEQKGYRPWLILSDSALNEVSPFVWAIPFTTSRRNYPLCYDWADENSQTTGTLLCNQLTSLDVAHRHWVYSEHVKIPAEVDYIIQAILGYK